MSGIPADNTGCPRCAAVNKAVGGGRDVADICVNYGETAWGACLLHNTRWGVTRRLGTLPEADNFTMAAFERVEPVLHVGTGQ